MRAIILAAGEGTRLRPLTLTKPKCMVEYNGKPILEYQVERFRACGVNDIVVVKGYREEAIKLPNLKYALNPKFDSTNMVYTLFCAQAYFDDDLIISYGDILYEKTILEALLKSPHEFSVVVSLNWRSLWEKRMENPLLDAETLKLDAKGQIKELGKKPNSYDEIEGQYMGLFKLKRSMVQKLKTLYESLDRTRIYDGKPFEKMFMTSFIQEAINRGIPVHAVKVTGEWLEIDSVKDLGVACLVGKGSDLG